MFLIIKKRKSFMGITPLAPRALKETILSLGASFIKLAQVLATRADFFSKEYLEQLGELHDQIPPMSEAAFARVFGRAFPTSPFESFEHTPIASASIGQVHRAVLRGEEVAVKLRRAGIRERVEADIRIIRTFHALFRPLFSYYTKNSIEAVIEEFAAMILEEVNLSTERSNLLKFSDIYAHSGIRFPRAYSEHSSEDALIMSFETGFRFDDRESVERYGVDIRSIIAKLVSFYTEQMLVKGYFHADPHPGNLLITPEGELVLLDFGMVKSVPNSSRIAIIELIKAANEQDYELYISASKRLGTVAYEAPTAQMAEFTAKMFDIFSNDNLSSESMQQLAFEVLESTRNFPFKLPSDAIYILRVSAIIEGLGTTYIENFNGIKDILPILQQNIPRALGAKDSILETLIEEVKELPFIARDIKSVVKQMSEGRASIEISRAQLEWLGKELRDIYRSTLLSLGLMLGGFFVLFYDHDLRNIALGLFVLGFVRLIYK